MKHKPSYHQPKGGMCATCTKRYNDCSDLDFENMQVIGVSDSEIIVRCTEFERTPLTYEQIAFQRWCY